MANYNDVVEIARQLNSLDALFNDIHYSIKYLKESLKELEDYVNEIESIVTDCGSNLFDIADEMEE